MESWRLVWRDGFVPVLSTAGSGSAAGRPPGRRPAAHPGQHHHPAPAHVRAGLAGRGRLRPRRSAAGRATDLETVGQVEEFFARGCFEADQRLGEPAACRWFLNWFDDTPRDEMRRELLAEVERALADRAARRAAGPRGRDDSRDDRRRVKPTRTTNTRTRFILERESPMIADLPPLLEVRR